MAERDVASRLRRAVQENNLFLVKRLVQRTDMRNPDPSNRRMTSLAWAATLGNEETFEFLLSTGHDDDEFSKDSENNTILILLADVKPPFSSPQHIDLEERDVVGAALRMAMLYYERYPETLDWANSQGKTALHVAALKGNEELVRTLCDLGADFNLADNQGNTPLHYASAWGHVPIVQLLIERGCSYTLRNNESFIASDYAYSFNTRDALQDTARIQFENNKKARRNVFAQAAQKGNEWRGDPSGPPVPPKHRDFSSATVRMRSGSGATTETTTTSDSDLDHNGLPAPHTLSQSSLSTTSSPSQPAQSSLTTTTSPGTSTIPLPKHSPGPSTSSLTLPSAASHSALSPIASRMRENDAAAMAQYLKRTRNRSGSADTASTGDARSQSDVTYSSTAATANGDRNFSSAGPSANGDDITSLQSVFRTGRRLKTSASATQLRSSPQPPFIVTANQTAAEGAPRSRSGTSPVVLRSGGPTSATPTTERTIWMSPTNTRTSPGASSPWSGPPRDFAQFPEPATQPRAPMPPPKEEPAPSSRRRLPFNLLSKPEQSGGHRRGASATAVPVRGT